MPILQALFGILQPSEGLLGTVDVIRRQIADALHAAKATSTTASAQPAVSWWCPCCRHHHDTACCSALARVSPCKHCGEGHSYRSCSLRREQANARAIKAHLAASQLSASSSIVFGDFGAVPIQSSVTQSASEVSEVAKVERTTGLRSPAPAKRTVAPQSPAAAYHAQPTVTAVVPARGDDVESHDIAPNSAISAFVHSEMDVLFMAREITTDALPNQEVFDAPVIVPVTTIVMADCSTQTDSPAVGVKALNYSREMVQGERTGVIPTASTSSPATAQHLTPSVSKAVPADPTHPAVGSAETCVPSESDVSAPRDDKMYSVSLQRPNRHRTGRAAPVMPIELYTLQKGHQGCCSHRNCGAPLFGSTCYVSSRDLRKNDPFKGYYICTDCWRDSKVYQQVFPHALSLHESPVTDQSDLASAYHTNQKAPGYCGRKQCGKPLGDHCWLATSNARGIHPLKSVYLCDECRHASGEAKFLFYIKYILSTEESFDMRQLYIVGGQCLRFSLPPRWSYPELPLTFQDLKDKLAAQFLYDFGTRVLCASLHAQAIPTDHQAQEEYFRAKITASGPCVPPRFRGLSSSGLINTNVLQALPALMSTGFTETERKSGPMNRPGSFEFCTFSCPHCQSSVPASKVVAHAGLEALRTSLFKRHLLASPGCKYFDQLKSTSTLPEFFVPESQQKGNKRQVQAAHRDRVNRLNAFVSSWNASSSTMHYTVQSSPLDPDSVHYNPWTDSEFDEGYWFSIVPIGGYASA